MNINRQNLYSLYCVTEFNPAKLALHPPRLPYDVIKAERVKEVTDTVALQAAYFDQYRDITLLGLRHADISWIGALCDEPGTCAVQGCTVVKVATEQELLGSFMNVMLDIAQGVTVPCWSGWKIHETWAQLLNKCLHYGLGFPVPWRFDLGKKWGGYEDLVEISNIYKQTANPALRKLPEFGDLLEYWGLGTFLPNYEIAKHVCDDTEQMVLEVQRYLVAMQELVLLYQGS